MAKDYKIYVDDEIRTDLKLKLVQARIPLDLAMQVENLCKANGWKTSYAVRGGLKKFIDDCTPRNNDDFALSKIFMESLSR